MIHVMHKTEFYYYLNTPISYFKYKTQLKCL
uniref:Uncharacterized protein n=1 Tax=Anguilla anguilla TaxID=7936 RepID=A0A0E9Q4P5_ANGAN